MDVSRGSLANAVAEYDSEKSRDLAPKSVRGYRDTLARLEASFSSTHLAAFEPPEGVALVETFLEVQWGHLAPRTYNGALSVVKGFFAWHVARGNLQANPADEIQRKRVDRAPRTAFTEEEREAVLRANPDARDRLPLRLLLEYGVAKGTLQQLRFGDFDQQRSQASVVRRGGRRDTLLIEDEEFWADFNRLRVEVAPEDGHYVLPRIETRRRRPVRARDLDELVVQLETMRRTALELADQNASPESEIALAKLAEALRFVQLWQARARTRTKVFPDQARGDHGVHDWWYRCLERAGIVDTGATRGQAMFKARHSVGRRLLEEEGTLKAVQDRLGVGPGGATAEVYSNRDTDELDTSMRNLLRQLRAGSREGPA